MTVSSARARPDGFATFAAVVAILAMFAAYGNLAALWAAAGGDPAMLADPTVLLSGGQRAAELFRLGMLLDIFGYYLPLLPLLVAIRARRQPPTSPWLDFAVICLAAYALFGALGATLLASGAPGEIVAYGSASASQREVMEMAARQRSATIFGGVWSLLGVLLAGCGWLVLAQLWDRSEPALRTLTFLAGTAAMVTAVGSIAAVPAVSSVGLLAHLALAPLWAAFAGGGLLIADRRRARP